MMTLKKVAVAACAFLALAAPALPSVAASHLVGTMSHDVGHGRPRGCPAAWCACYLNQTLARTGHRPLGSNRARDFAHYGHRAAPGQVGAIMVMAHHVGVVAGRCDDGRVKLVSGNHSHRVGAGCYSPGRAIAWRMPA